VNYEKQKGGPFYETPCIVPLSDLSVWPASTYRSANPPDLMHVLSVRMQPRTQCTQSPTHASSADSRDR